MPPHVLYNKTSSSAFHLFFFFFNDTATTEIYTLSLHDALPISAGRPATATGTDRQPAATAAERPEPAGPHPDRKSTRLNSSHSQISYAVFCLKKKNLNLDAASPLSSRGNHRRRLPRYRTPVSSR